MSGFVLAVGSTILPAEYTFNQTKRLDPPFIRQYVGTMPTGEPVYNPGIVNKSVSTIEKAKAKKAVGG